MLSGSSKCFDTIHALLPDDTKITVRNQATGVSDYSGDVQHKAWRMAYCFA
ncbi:hypothetical protein [Methanosarcina mazei]|uniref:hypothetical protein n=1 Tax=Methanosarcina mazei TaxID=2209 RepID=UPI0012D471B5|nr:hypothetical protein [Methanosarcina mazei]